MKNFKNVLKTIMLIFSMLIFTACSDVQQSTDNANNDELKIHFIDVGQADSILIQEPSGKSMLIDAGNNDDFELVKDYITSNGITKLDYVVGTHPHEDHIGGLDVAIDSFDVENVILPNVNHTTKTYQDVLKSIKNKNLKITPAKSGNTFNLGDAKCEILAPNSEKYEELNNYSVVIKLTYKNNSFLFTGDAEDLSEKEMINKGYNLKSDVLKVGHHGSNSSSTSEFLTAVSPKISIISVGKGNDYGHPKQKILDRLNKINTKTYRTDEIGTIVLSSDGNIIKVNDKDSVTTSNTNTSNNTSSSSNSDDNITVYTTKSGSKYHIDGCNGLQNSKIKTSLKDAKAKGYGPCGTCNPPV